MNINPIERRGPARLSDADYRELEANLSDQCHIAMTATPRTVGDLRRLIDGLPPETRLFYTDGDPPIVTTICELRAQIDALYPETRIVSTLSDPLVVTLLYDDNVVCQYVEIGQ